MYKASTPNTVFLWTTHLLVFEDSDDFLMDSKTFFLHQRNLAYVFKTSDS